MATIIDALVVTLGLDSSSFQQGEKDVGEGLKKIRDDAGSTAKDMEARGKQAASFVSAIKSELIGLFAVVTAGKGLTSFITDSITGTAALGRFAANLGMSARELDGWGTAAEAFGGTAEGVRASMQHIAGGIQQFALTGESDLIPIFRSMGVAVSDSSGKVRDYREIMLDVADKLKGMSAQEALSFGKMLGLDDGTITLLRQGRVAVTDLVGQMTKASGITDQSVEASQKAQKSWAIFNQQMRGIGQTIFNELAPALEVAVAWLTDLSQWVTSHHDQVVMFFAAAAAGATAFALATIEIWGPIVLIAGAIAALAAGVTYLWQEWQTWTNGGKSSLGDLFQVATDVFNAIRAVVAENIDTVKKLFFDWFEAVKSIFAFVVALATGSTADIRKAWKDLTGDLGNFFGDWIKIVQNLAPKIGEALIRAFKGAWSYLKERFGKISSLFDGDDSNDEDSDSAESGSGSSSGSIGGSGGTPEASIESGDVAKKFVEMGWTPEQAAGIAANLKKESEFRPDAVGDGGQAYGIAQWHKDRQDAFKKWSGKDIKGSSRDEQLAFVNYELRQGNEQAAGKKLAAATTAEEAGAIVSKHYERPAAREQEAAERGRLAQAIAAAAKAANGSGGTPLPEAVAGVGVGAGVKAANTTNNASNTNSSEISIAKIEVNTQAKDAEGIAKGIGEAIQQNGLVNQAATGDS